MMITVRVMDPPGDRKAHARATPKGGGVGVLVSFLVGLAVLYRFAAFARLADPYFLGVIEASVAIAMVAFLDDLFDWPFTVKLSAQFLAALIAVSSGLYVQNFHLPYLGAVLPFAWIGVPATVAWILFTTNAVNFIDGLDGLAGGVALIACLFLGFIAERHDGWFGYAAARLVGLGPGRISAVQLSAGAHLPGRCRQPILRLHARCACRGRQPLRGRRAILPADAHAALWRPVRCRLHLGPPDP